VAHNLDEEIRAELYSHMEDKLLGYLSGGEKVTEEDAFILVREHFGNPAVIRSLLQEAHAVEDGVSFLRKLGAVATASLVTMSGVHLLWLAFRYLLPKGQTWIDNILIVRHLLAWGHVFGPVLLLGIVLGVWRKMMENGRSLWFYTFNSERFAAVLIGLIFLMIFIFLPREKVMSVWEHSVLLVTARGYEDMLANILQCMLWLWWTGTDYRKHRTLLLTALIWIGFIELSTLIRLHVSGNVSLFEHPLLYCAKMVGFTITAMITTGLYIIIRNLGSMRDRLVEIVNR
jgi:hypothetical protein